jgi:hypothetical protein
MSVQILSLASGYLPNAANPIYTSPVGPPALTTIIKSIRLVNTDSVPRTVNLYVNRVADPNNRYITPVNLTIPAGGLVIDDQEIALSSGDKIQYDTTATHIDFVISGIQR